jgi:hypothetical protein
MLAGYASEAGYDAKNKKKAPVWGNFESNYFSSYVLLAFIARGQ